MANINAGANYPLFSSVVTAVGQVGTVIYWDDVANSGQFRALALVDGGRSSVFYAEGGLSTAPASFSTDFPNAVSVPGSFSA